VKGTTEVIFYQNLVEASTYEALFELAKVLYREKGWVCIPFKIEKNLSAKGKEYTKTPIGRWGQLVEGKVSVEEYWKEMENSLPYNQVLTITGIGLITGKTSQITILDIDDPKTFEETTGFKIQDLLKKTLAVRTINGGYHFYFKYDPEVKTGTYQHLGLDIRNNKALAVIPPSFCMEEPPKEIAKAFDVEVEIDGPKYEWLNDLEPIEFPKELKQLLSKPNQIQQKVENQEWKKLSEEQIKTLELNKHELPELNREKVREALEILNYYFEKYAKEKPAEAATVLKWALVAPFNWVKKQAGKKALFKWLFLLGSPDTGKTTDAEIFTRWIWGLEENATSGSSLQTASRIAQKADRWTFSNIVNEASSLFSKNPKSDEIRELLRQIWDGTIAREKRRQNGQRVVELAAATFIFTANETPTLYQGDIKRIEIIKYNPKARVVDKNTFEADFNYDKRAKLAYIGSAVYEWAKKNLDLILEVDDYRMLGELILTYLYEEYFNGQIPEWVNLKLID